MEGKVVMTSAEKIFRDNRKLEEERRSKDGDPMSYRLRE